MGSDSAPAGAPETHPSHGSNSKWALPLAALGIVYGDIGTSPLYALRECFHGPHGIPISESSVLGVLSLVFWILVLTISIKYMVFVLRADNRGEGGILALTALAVPQKEVKKSFVLFALGIFGAALLYGDGVLTPAITVLSAIEGLTIATPVFEPVVVPITVAILIALFAFQNHGTAKIGAVFGPIMLLWFATIGLLGLAKIVGSPSILQALSPHFAIEFVLLHKAEAFFVMGSIFLVVTGGEALYADMGHFGKSPIRKAWFYAVLPGLLLNYFGQGVLLLEDPKAAENPFFLMAPGWSLYPLVVLATLASVIASQALISGVFSLTRQAIQLGLCPRLKVVHTSNREIGQIYLPQMNWALLAGCVWLVVSFKSSSNLAAAYGISVSSTMVITTILMSVVAKKLWGWSPLLSGTVTAFFLLVDLVFFSANAIKIEQGGYIPLLIGGVIYAMMTTWRRGREILAERIRATVIRLPEFLASIRHAHLARVPGSAVFMVGDPNTTPPAFIHNVKHNKCLHELVVILTVVTKEIPTVEKKDRVQLERVEDNIYRAVAMYGFSDSPDMMEVMASLREKGLDLHSHSTTFFLGRETLIASSGPGMALWRDYLFSFMSKNAQRATAFFNIPVDQVIEVGIQIEI